MSLRPLEKFSPLSHEFRVGGMVQMGAIFGRGGLLLRLVHGHVQRHLALLQRHLVVEAVRSVRAAVPTVDRVVVMQAERAFRRRRDGSFGLGRGGRGRVGSPAAAAVDAAADPDAAA